MATQHHDNAGAPYWETQGDLSRETDVKRDAFVSTQEELTECLSAYQDLKAEEFMWDWEGKYTDEAVIDKLFARFHAYFKANQIGRDRFLTFRLPNVWHEKGYSLLRALTVILTSEDFARDLGFYAPPLFEVIIPMVEKSEQLMYIQRSFQKLARFKQEVFSHSHHKHNDYLEIIPLVEGVDNQVRIGDLLDEYAREHKKYFGRNPRYIRPFLARSDPALMSGLLATVLANRVALSEIKNFSRRTGIKTYPIIGVGSLVFRGGLEPDKIKNFCDQYAGVRTVTVQSAFRYDYPLSQVKKAIKLLEKELPKRAAMAVAPSDLPVLKKIIKQSARVYQETLQPLIKPMSKMFEAVPRRRERKLHIGLLGYSRNLGKQKIPRAINFTAAFYSLGIPPEFIGLGRTLAGLNEAERVAAQKYYAQLLADLTRAGNYLNKDNLRLLAARGRGWKLVEQDVAAAEKFFGVKFGPRTRDHFLHKNLTSNLVLLKNNPEEIRRLIAKTGCLRRSLG